MSKFNPKKLSIQEKHELLDELFMAISLMPNFKDVKIFLKDLLTESEAVMLARRLQIAKMLMAGYTLKTFRMRCMLA